MSTMPAAGPESGAFLKASLAALPGGEAGAGAAAARPADDAAVQPPALASNLIYFASSHTTADPLAAQVAHFGYRVQAFSDLPALRAAMDAECPLAVLMDAAWLESDPAGIEAARAPGGGCPQGPAIFYLADNGDIRAHLSAVRAGGQDYFVRPVDIGSLIDALDRLTGAQDNEPYRVLIVDDSAVQAKVNSLHLQKAGIRSQIISNPLEVKTALENFHPDLLLLDLYMPECNGLELAQVIRQMRAFVSLPIVYLSSETDREKQLSAVGIGGDDFLTKPIKPGHLVSAVTSRIDRYRQLRALMMRDSLTGLFNHSSIRDRLGQELVRATRYGQPLSLAMIDIDHFKHVNDTYGHAAGDRILKSLSRMLSHRLRRSDSIGRYGGEEFVVILPNTTGPVARNVLEELRSDFAQLRHLGDTGEFTVTFSSGVAAFPWHRTALSLREAADRSLYAAKHEGRNRVVLAGEG